MILVLFVMFFVALWVFVPQCDLLLWKLKHRAKEKTIALTFDDGPLEPWTSHILDILKHEGVRATFFVVGKNVTKHPELITRMASEGHAIGNHTFSHRKLPFLTRRTVEDEIDRCNRTLFELLFVTPTLFRAPHGFRHLALPGILKRRSMRHIPWGRGVWDTDHPGAAIVLERSIRHPKKMEILLLHDSIDDTADALPDIIATYQQRGYTFKTIDQLLA